MRSAAVWILLALLVVLHQLDLAGSDGRLAWGVVPAALLYHVALSVAAAVVWFLATRWAWPLDAEVDEGTRDEGRGTRAGEDAGPRHRGERA